MLQVCSYTVSTIQVTSSLVVKSDKINTCSVYTQKAYLCAACISVAPCPRDQLNAKDADRNVTTKLILTLSIVIFRYLLWRVRQTVSCTEGFKVTHILKVTFLTSRSIQFEDTRCPEKKLTVANQLVKRHC